MVRGAGGRRGAVGGGRGSGRGGRGGGGDHLGRAQAVDGTPAVPEAADGAPAVPGDGDAATIAADAQGVINQNCYERSHERFTWKGVLRPHADHMKRTKILPHARSREKKVTGSCVYCSIATALEAANRACGVEVGELAWEELYEMVREDHPHRIHAALRVLKYRGIRSKADYEKRNLNGKRFRISQFCEFCNIGIIDDDVTSGLDCHNMKAAIDNMLSKSVILAHFPISDN